MIDPLERHQF